VNNCLVLLAVLALAPALSAADVARDLALELLRREEGMPTVELRQRLQGLLADGSITVAEAVQLATLAQALNGGAPVPMATGPALRADTTRRAELALAELAATLDGVPPSVATPASPPAAPSPATSGPAVAPGPLRLAAVMPAAADRPALVLVEGEGVAGLGAGQRLAVQREGAAVVELQVLRTEGGRAMAVVLAATWTVGASTELQAGETVLVVD